MFTFYLCILCSLCVYRRPLPPSVNTCYVLNFSLLHIKEEIQTTEAGLLQYKMTAFVIVPKALSSVVVSTTYVYVDIPDTSTSNIRNQATNNTVLPTVLKAQLSPSQIESPCRV